MTTFRYFHLHSRRRDVDTDLTLEYLAFVWESQAGLCPYTGWSLALPLSTACCQARSGSLEWIEATASLQIVGGL